jgi:hypothetical protein
MLMMNNFMKKSFLALFFGLVLISCSEDEPQVDFKEQAVGTYSINIDYVDNRGNSISDNLTGQISIEGNNLLFSADGERETLIGVREASNGLTFNIENDTDVDEDGDTYSIKGTKNVTLDGSNYDGRFDTASGELYFQIEYVYVNRDFSDFDAVITFSGFKK